MSKFDTFKDLVLTNGKDLAVQLLSGFAEIAKDIAQTFLENSKQDLEDWGRALARGQLTQLEFEDLVAGRLDLAQMAALTAQGAALAQVERFRKGLIQIIADAATTAFLP